MESLWRKQTKDIPVKTKIKQNEKQEENWDVIVIGAGMAGLLTAYYLKEQGKKVLVLEAAQVASGQTERTTAKITSQHGVKYSKLIETVGAEKARLYAQANETAIREYEHFIKSKGIDCQFERLPAYLYTMQDENILMEEAKSACLLGIDAFFTRETELPFPIKGALCFNNQAQFSPLEFVKYLSSQLEILEHTKVTQIRGHQVFTENNTFTAEKIIVATHYPLKNLPGFYFLRQHQERSYVLALSGCKKINGMYYGIDENGLSLRQAGEFLLLGGSPSRTGANDNGRAYDALIEAAEQYFPGSQEVTRWSAQDCMPHDGIPFIGKYSCFTPNLYVITGFQKWGMTTSMIAALILRDTLCGLDNPYAKLFSPQRMNCKAAMSNLLMDVGMSVKGLTRGFFHHAKDKAITLSCGQGGIVTVDGKTYACYRDEKGMLHQISHRCAHMGCELEWNPNEKSWDCPCHGSRFDVDGKLLDNPSKKSIEK